MKGFYHIWAWRPSWSCDPDAPNKHSFHRLMEAPHEICLRLAQQFWRRSLKMVDGWTDANGRWTDDRACLYYKLTSEPKGSGELKIVCCTPTYPLLTPPSQNIFWQFWKIIFFSTIFIRKSRYPHHAAMKEKEKYATKKFFFPTYLPNQKIHGRGTANKQVFKDGPS